ncbi:hypothetical protein Emag_007283 [Eimeria magna]
MRGAFATSAVVVARPYALTRASPMPTEVGASVSGTKSLANRSRLEFRDASQPTLARLLSERHMPANAVQRGGGKGLAAARLITHPPVPNPPLRPPGRHGEKLSRRHSTLSHLSFLGLLTRRQQRLRQQQAAEPPPLSSPATSAIDALGDIAGIFEKWDITAARCVGWSFTAFREYRAAREDFELLLEALQWVQRLSRPMAAPTAPTLLNRFSEEPCVLTGLANRKRLEQLWDSSATDDQVERLVGFWWSSRERLAALMGRGRASPRAAALPGASAEEGLARRQQGPASESSLPEATDKIEPPPLAPPFRAWKRFGLRGRW